MGIAIPVGAALPAHRFNRLRIWNLSLGVLHLAQAVVMMLVSTDFSLPVTAAFVRLDPATNSLAPQLEVLTRVSLGPMVALFLLLSAVAHLAVAAPRIHQWYERNVGAGINRARWMEYALSSSVMIIVIALLVGIYDVVSLMLIFALNATMILFGWMMELHNQTTTKTSWTSFWFGTFAGAVPWVAVGVYLAGAGGEGGEVPAFVYWIFGSIFLFFNVFALNMVLQYKKVGPWRDYLFGERAYMLLSLVAKSLLAWQVFAGTLRPV